MAVGGNQLEDKRGWVVSWSRCCPRRQGPALCHSPAGQTTWIFWGSVSSSIKQWSWTRWVLSKSTFSILGKEEGRQTCPCLAPTQKGEASTDSPTRLRHLHHLCSLPLMPLTQEAYVMIQSLCTKHLHFLDPPWSSWTLHTFKGR